jgi:hypothetical protein
MVLQFLKTLSMATALLALVYSLSSILESKQLAWNFDIDPEYRRIYLFIKEKPVESLMIVDRIQDA